VRQLNGYLQRLHKARWFILCLMLVVAIAVGDYATGYELSLSILYLGPVFIATWILGRTAGIVFSVISLVAWFVSVDFMGHIYPHPFYHFWEAVIRLVTWIVFAVLLAKLKVALAHSDERFVTVLEGLDAAVYVSDTQTGELLYANEQFRKAFAASAPPQTTNENEAEFRDSIAGRWYLIHSRAIRWVDGRLVRLNIATDVTARKQAEELGRQQLEKLQMTSRLITVGEMASTLAHEINQPLAAIANYIMGCVRRLGACGWDARELLEAMEKASAQAERAGTIIQRVREFVRKREPEFAACDLNEIITEVAQMVAIEAEESAVRVKLELEPALRPVRADKVMIEQVVLNLVKNAIESMQDTAPERRRLAIRSSAGAGGGAHAEVADHGLGLPRELEENLFTPFFTTKPQGMGMGLHICRSIIEMHDGRLWASRNPGGGSTFHFSLPAAQT
jgi:C4-dicarboxylate-specific signal transduction histidine kinase